MTHHDPLRRPAATRRALLRAGAGVCVLLTVRPAAATPEAMEEAVRAFAGGTPVRAGKVVLEVAPLVENGNTVPLSVTVDHPMTPDDHVTTIALFNERNPQPHVAVFHLSPRAGRAEVATRVRLRDSQTLLAVARLSDGSLWSATAQVIVTLPACAEG